MDGPAPTKLTSVHKAKQARSRTLGARIAVNGPAAVAVRSFIRALGDGGQVMHSRLLTTVRDYRWDGSITSLTPDSLVLIKPVATCGTETW